MKYLLIDTNNVFMRAKHSGARGADSVTQQGLALHITLNSIKKAWEQFNPDHVVFGAEGRSWRKDYDTDYKRNRDVAKKKLSVSEKEDMAEFFQMVNDFCTFVKEKTNCTFLQNSQLEADDCIAGWIQHHPTDMHYIVSTDGDFHQLIDFNVQQYNPITGYLFTKTGVFTEKGNLAKDKKGVALPIPDPELSLFLKCVKGDTSDNVFSAYPGVRMKSTKKAIGIMECFTDRTSQGYAWNSFMNQKWGHHDGSQRTVKYEYAKNEILVDLTKQPDFIKDIMTEVIKEAKKKEPVKMIGIYFLRFTEKYLLKSIQQYPDRYVQFLSSKDE